MKKYFVLICFLILSSANSFAQSEIEMADVMRSNGKIYVVVGVIAIVFTGIVIYLVSIDRKVSKLEKKIENKNQVT